MKRRGVKSSVEVMECADSTIERSLDVVLSAVRDESKGHAKMMRLNPGEK
ncbi:hypothetical protein PI124_g16627 [Phytophthora idaei]|nr:hypothetical protein PI125_g22450 [Phytophthora idaei]KAG3134341.1 hypothetical protein PI126_g18728 [Phytophthora idaei]KAG3238414.1 hypothetical protein PI124_g16627 [Phytophthora idaei]